MACLAAGLIACSDGGTSDTDEELGESGVITETADTDSSVVVDGEPLDFKGEAPSNLLIVSVDTLRADFTYGDVYGHTTPFLQELISEGLVLEEHMSCSNWTVASLYCLLTGRSTAQIGIHPLSDKMLRLPNRELTMAEMFQQSGRATSLLSANPLFSEPLGLAQGFDTIQMEISSAADVVTTQGIDLIAQHMSDESGDGWFSQIHYYDPHGGYDPPAEFLGDVSDLAEIAYDITTNDGLRDLRNDESVITGEERALIREHMIRYYGGEVRFLDDQLKRLFESLDEIGALDGTLVLFISDHGEQLLEHGAAEHLRDLYREEIHVPAFFWMKDQGIASGVWSEPTNHQDILPSLISPFGLQASDVEFDGVELGEADVDRIPVALHGVPQGSAVLGRMGDYELIYRWSGALELYNIKDDPNEVSNIFAPIDLSIVDQIWPSVEAAASALADVAKLDAPIVPAVYR